MRVVSRPEKNSNVRIYDASSIPYSKTNRYIHTCIHTHKNTLLESRSDHLHWTWSLVILQHVSEVLLRRGSQRRDWRSVTLLLLSLCPSQLAILLLHPRVDRVESRSSFH